jgi:glycosyltransferase involved in cell wall biosynthesis
VDRVGVKVINVLFDDRIAGPQRRVIEVGRHLKRFSVETVVCMPEGSGEAAALAAEEGLRVRRVNFRRIPRPSNVLGVLRWIAAFPGDVRRLSEMFRTERAEVVHVNGAFFLAPAIAAKKSGLPLVWHLNDTIVSRKMAWILGRTVRLLADRIVVAAEAVARYYGVESSPYDVVYAPVDVERFGGTCRRERRGRNIGVRVGCVANWYPVKGIEYFIRACALLRDALGDDRLEIVLVGSKLSTQPEYCRMVDTLIDALDLRARTTCLGLVRDVSWVLVDLDVLVLSSTSEACPMAVLEAMSSGVPVVATDVGGVRELVGPDPDGSAGLVVAARDPAAIARAMLAIIESSELAERLSCNGWQRARERFSLDMCTERHLTVYSSVLGRGIRSDPSCDQR